MSERGVFAVDRGIFDHPLFAGDPFSDREAWMWLLAEAAWKPHKRFVGSVEVDLRRGQVAVSLRYLAEKWKWSKSKVERFLQRLEAGRPARGGRPPKNLKKPSGNSDALIETESGTGITIITICNYSKYQRTSLPRGTPSGTPVETAARQQRDKEEYKEYRESIKEGDGDSARERPLISAEANELADECAKIVGHDPDFLPPAWCGGAWNVQSWLNDGWPRELILQTVKAESAKKRDGPAMSIRYFEAAIARTVARARQPAPKIVEIPARTVEVENGANRESSAIGGAKRIAERISQQFGESSPYQIGGGSNGPHVRLLQEGRCERSGDLRIGSSGGVGGIRTGRDHSGDGPEDWNSAQTKVLAKPG